MTDDHAIAHGTAALEQALKFRLAIERSSDAVFMTAPDGTITYVNPAFERLYGFTSSEAIGKTPRLLKSGAQDAGFYERLWATLVAKQVAPSVMINRTKGGGLVHVESTANPILDGGGEILGFLAIQRDITERRRVEQRLRESEQALRESEAQYRGLFDNNPVPTWLFDTETMRFLAVNCAAVCKYGYSRDEFSRMSVMDIRPPEDVPRLSALARDARPGVIAYGVWKHRKKDGTFIEADITGQTLEVRGRRCMIVYAQDVTGQKLLEDQLRHAQKMEAVGRLAGGVAHDFNNLLSVILSYADIALESLPPGHPLRDDIAEVARAGRRATELTRQLLAFSRRQVLQPKVVDLNESLAGMQKMLARVLGEDIEMRVDAGEALWKVKVDPGQLEQVVMNLVVNARDAMPDGGTLTIETRNVEFDEASACLHPGTRPGPHVSLAVSDDGVGMDEATKARVFEPFFTTKDPGRGTGLGLSTVFGIVQQSGGSIVVDSAPGEGTTFEICFPRCEERSSRPSAPPPSTRARVGKETILLTEDDEQLRDLVGAILRRKGYEVLAAATPADALRLSEQHAGPIHLLLTDVVMPGMNGRQLAERVRTARPDTRVLFVSGYAGGAAVHQGLLCEGTAFLPKPITPEAILREVRALLDEE